MSVSVCLASYNGSKFIRRQIESILAELGPRDELIVVDDASTDDTVEQVRRIGDPRIRLEVNPRNQREVLSFSHAMSLARNDVVFLSDQDDVWVPGRVRRMSERLEQSGASVVTTNFTWMTAAEEPIEIPFDGVHAEASRRHLRNIVDIFIGRTNYFGCAMAIRRDFLDLILPIPRWVESHDLWIALASNLVGSNVHLDDATLRKRQHGGNATSTVSRRRLSKKLWSRVVFALSLAVLQARRLKWNPRSQQPQAA